MRTGSISRFLPDDSTMLRIILILFALTASSIRISASDSLRHVLFPDGRIIGQPLSRLHTDIRMVRVESAQEGYGIFRQLCITEHTGTIQHQGHTYEYCYLPECYGGYLIFTCKVRPGRHEVGIIYIRSPILNILGIKEIHFVETIKL